MSIAICGETELMPNELDQAVEEFKTEHDAFAGFARKTLQSMIRLGEILETKIRPHVPDGEWKSWCQDNLECSYTHAMRYIKAWRKSSSSNKMLPDDKNHEATLQQILEAAAIEEKEAKEEKHQRALEMLREGTPQDDIRKELRMSGKTITKLYQTVVLPELRAVDWKAQVKGCRLKCPEMAVARLSREITAQRKAAPKEEQFGTWYAYAAAQIPELRSGVIADCLTIINQGCPQLIKRVEDAEIAASAAVIISRKPEDEQRKEMLAYGTRKLTTMKDDLKSMVNNIIDQKVEFERLHPNALQTLSSLKGNGDLEEIVNLLGQASSFFSTIEKLSREAMNKCHSQLTVEPTTSSTPSESNSPTKTECLTPI